MASSPWGAIQHSEQVTRGVRAVTTAGHGGMMVTKKFAERHFSAAAQTRGMTYGRNGEYLCYEEDCDFMIAWWEMRKMGLPHPMFKQISEEDAVKDLSRWNPEYLMEVGVAPDPEAYAHWQASQLRDQMRQEKHPDLIVSAIRAGAGRVKVTTADGKGHMVANESYNPAVEGLNLLSKCVLA